MEPDQASAMPPANNNFLQHMFIEFLCTQTTAQATQAPHASHAKSERFPDPEIFSRERFSIEYIHERLESFGIALDLTMTLNLDRMPMPEASNAYTFSRTSGTAQQYIAPKIQARLYQDWTDVLQDLKNAFSDPDLDFFAQHKLIRLCQANRTFTKFYTEFSRYAGRSEFNDKALKCHLRCVISEERSCQLVSTNIKDLSLLQLVQKCQTQDNQLRGAVTKARKTMPRPQLSTKPNQTRVPSVVQSTVPSNLPKPAMPNINAMDPTHSKLTVQERECRHTQGLCFHCDLAGHITSSCPFKPSGGHIRTIQEVSTAQPTQDAS